MVHLNNLGLVYCVIPIMFVVVALAAVVAVAASILLVLYFKRQICVDGERSLVISRKLSQIDPYLLWDTVRKLAPLILLPHSDPSQTPLWGDSLVSNKNANLTINTASCSMWRQATAVVNRARPSSHRRCCQLLSTEWDRLKLLLTVIVGCVDNVCGMTLKSSNKRRTIIFLFSIRYIECLFHFRFLSRSAMLKRDMAICPSVTRWYWLKTNDRTITQFFGMILNGLSKSKKKLRKCLLADTFGFSYTYTIL